MCSSLDYCNIIGGDKYEKLILDVNRYKFVHDWQPLLAQSVTDV